SVLCASKRTHGALAHPILPASWQEASSAWDTDIAPWRDPVRVVNCGRLLQARGVVRALRNSGLSRRGEDLFDVVRRPGSADGEPAGEAAAEGRRRQPRSAGDARRDR